MATLKTTVVGCSTILIGSILVCGLCSGVLNRKNGTATTASSSVAVPQQSLAAHNPVTGNVSSSQPVDDLTPLVDAEFARQSSRYDDAKQQYDKALADRDASEMRLQEIEKNIESHKLAKPTALSWEDRTWFTFDKSHSTEGRFVSATQDTVEVGRTDGKTVKVPIDKLIAGDRVYIEKQSKAVVDREGESTGWEQKRAELTAEAEEVGKQIVLATNAAPVAPSRDDVVSHFARKRADRVAAAQRARDGQEMAEAKAQQDRAEARANRPQMNKLNYERCRPGMTYQQVLAIVGDPNETLSESKFGDIHTVMYMWKGGIIANANMTFQNDKLVSKAQIGL